MKIQHICLPLLSFVPQAVYVPLMLYNESWQISVTKDFKEDLDKFLTTLTESIYEAKGQTLLYLPPLELTGSVAVLAKNKELTQRLESILIRWTRQIKEVNIKFSLVIDLTQILPFSAVHERILCSACEGFR